MSRVQRRPRVLPVRLRYLLLFVVAGLSARSLGSRALAFWQLHGAAADMASYAACMAGPTGPELLYRRPDEFAKLVRRRVLAAPPDARPLATCVPALRAFVGAPSPALMTAHEAKAGEFEQYGALAASASRTGLDALAVSAAGLGELAKRAWPFAPEDIGPLLRPPRSAKTAPHPAEPPVPARGRGLPSSDLGYSAARTSAAGEVLLISGQGANQAAFRSRDGGATWHDADVESLATSGVSGPCAGRDGSGRFRLRATGERLIVDSWNDGALETSYVLAPSDARVLGFACDEGAALAIVRDERARSAFRICPHGAPCRSLSVPPAVRSGLELARASIARVKGVAVIALTRAGVVRVVSSRDDGDTWTPPVVAYDREEQARRGDSTPARLLSLGETLLLYAGAPTAASSYPVLFSSDFGASWHAP